TPDLSSEREPHRSAHLRGVFGLLLVGDVAGPFAQAGWRADVACRAGQVWIHPDGGCALPHGRWTRTGLPPLHPTGEGPQDIADAIGLAIAGATPAPDHRQRRAGRTHGLRGFWCRPFGARP